MTEPEPAAANIPSPASDHPLTAIPVQRPSQVEPARFDGDQFARDWPRIAATVRRRLAGYGCPASDREDITQDTAVRLLNRRLPYANSTDLEHYALRVAKNLYISQWRKRSLVTVEISESQEILGADDVSVIIERRLALDAIQTGWNSLSLEDKSLLANEQTDSTDRRAANREKVQRHRLRVRLKALTAGLLGPAIALLATSTSHPPTPAPRQAIAWNHHARPARRQQPIALASLTQPSTFTA